MVDHEGQTGHIDSASGNVGGDHKLNTLHFAGSHHFIALLRHQVSLENITRYAESGQLAKQSDCVCFGAAENEPTLGLLALEKSGDEGVLFLPLAYQKLVIDGSIHDVCLINLNRVGLGRHATLDEHMNRLGKGGGKKPGAAPLTGQLENFIDLLFEAEAQHFIGFVEHEVFNGIKGERPPLDEVDQPSWSSDHDVGRSPQ